MISYELILSRDQNFYRIGSILVMNIRSINKIIMSSHMEPIFFCALRTAWKSRKTLYLQRQKFVIVNFRFLSLNCVISLTHLKRCLNGKIFLFKNARKSSEIVSTKTQKSRLKNEVNFDSRLSSSSTLTDIVPVDVLPNDVLWIFLSAESKWGIPKE